MLKVIVALTLCLSAVSAFAANFDLSEGDVSSVADQMKAKFSKGELNFSPVGNISAEEFHQSMDPFFRLMSSNMECLVETSKEPMTFDCQVKNGSFVYTFQATGAVHLDNGQVIGVSLDESKVTVFIKK